MASMVAVHIARNVIDIAYRRKMRDMHIDPMEAACLCFCFCAQERAAFPGPPWRGGWAKESPQDGPHGRGPVFRRYRDVPSENPVARTRTRKAGCLEGASPGWPLFYVGHPALRP